MEFFDKSSQTENFQVVDVKSINNFLAKLKFKTEFFNRCCRSVIVTPNESKVGETFLEFANSNHFSCKFSHLETNAISCNGGCWRGKILQKFLKQESVSPSLPPPSTSFDFCLFFSFLFSSPLFFLQYAFCHFSHSTFSLDLLTPLQTYLT